MVTPLMKTHTAFKRPTTATFKEISPVSPTKLKYQFDQLDIHIKHNVDSPTSRLPDINMIYIKSTTDLPTSPDSAMTIESVSGIT